MRGNQALNAQAGRRRWPVVGMGVAWPIKGGPLRRTDRVVLVTAGTAALGISVRVCFGLPDSGGQSLFA